VSGSITHGKESVKPLQIKKLLSKAYIFMGKIAFSSSLTQENRDSLRTSRLLSNKRELRTNSTTVSVSESPFFR
jgi:hypothetical protein